jgi:hypothetical protein
VNRDELFRLARTSYEHRVLFLSTSPEESRCVLAGDGWRMEGETGRGGASNTPDPALTKRSEPAVAKPNPTVSIQAKSTGSPRLSERRMA